MPTLAPPALSVPPDWMVVDETVPVPVSAAPLATVTPLELAMEPVTFSAPDVTLVAPV